MIVLKNILLFSLTISTETLLLWGVAKYLGWYLMDILLLGGTLIFGVVWLGKLYSNQTRNQYNAFSKIDYKERSLRVAPFYLKFSPVILALIVFNIVSFILTVIIYLPYFVI